MSDEALDLLEELLSITEGTRHQLQADDRNRWSHIAARCADLRDGEDV